MPHSHCIISTSQGSRQSETPWCCTLLIPGLTAYFQKSTAPRFEVAALQLLCTKNPRIHTRHDPLGRRRLHSLHTGMAKHCSGMIQNSNGGKIVNMVGKVAGIIDGELADKYKRVQRAPLPPTAPAGPFFVRL